MDSSPLLRFLRQRKEMVEKGTLIDGIKMIPIETLLLSRSTFQSSEAEELGSVVNEIIWVAPDDLIEVML